MFRDHIPVTFSGFVTGLSDESRFTTQNVGAASAVGNISWRYANNNHGAGFDSVDLTGLDTSLVTDLGAVFDNGTFNQDIGGWDVSNVTTLQWMFRGATSFNQDLGGWNVSGINDMSGMFDIA